MAGQQGLDGGQRIMMQAAEEAARALGLGQTLAMPEIIGVGHALELQEKFILAVGQEQDLNLAEVLEFAGGLTPTQTPLMASQTPKEAFQLEVIGWQARNVIAVQQIGGTAVPAFFQGAVKGVLGRLHGSRGVKLVEPSVDRLVDRLAGQRWRVGQGGLGLGRIVEGVRDLDQPTMGGEQIGCFGVVLGQHPLYPLTQ